MIIQKDAFEDRLNALAVASWEGACCVSDIGGLPNSAVKGFLVDKKKKLEKTIEEINSCIDLL